MFIRTNLPSTSVEAIRYEAHSQLLVVLFRSGGVYDYFKVPAEAVARWLSAPSLGRFFASEIRGTYGCRALTGADASRWINALRAVERSCGGDPHGWLVNLLSQVRRPVRGDLVF